MVEGCGCVTIGVRRGVGRVGGRVGARLGVAGRRVGVVVLVPGRGVGRVGVLAVVVVDLPVERLVEVVPYPDAPGVESAGRSIPPP